MSDLMQWTSKWKRRYLTTLTWDPLVLDGSIGPGIDHFGRSEKNILDEQKGSIQ